MTPPAQDPEPLHSRPRPAPEPTQGPLFTDFREYPHSEVTVVFRLDEAHTRWGESIVVVGECEGLGNWIPEKALALRTNGASYPQWKSAEAQLTVQGQLVHNGRCGQPTCHIRYKYLKDCRATGQGYAWEQFLVNREIKIPVVPGQKAVWEVIDAGFDKMIPGRLRQLLPEEPPRILCKKGGESNESTPEQTPEREVPAPAAAFDAKYVLLGNRPVARGGFSTVWLCRSQSANQQEGEDEMPRCAVKRILKTAMPPRSKKFLFGRGSFAGEIKLHTSLNHPHIVQLFEVFDDTDVVSLVLEYCGGGDLLEVVLQHARKYESGLTEPAAANMAKQLFVALAFLHDKGIVHRDVKCENILKLEAPDDQPLEKATYKLADFGLATHVLPDEVLLDQVGSPSTSAPEVVHRRPYAKPADIWSAGAALYTALAARRPFEAASYSQMRAHSSKLECSFRGRPWDHTSEEALNLVTSLLQPQANKRPTAQTALDHAWLSRA